MARLTLDQIEKVEKTYDIVQLVGRHTELIQNGDIFIGKCPLCNDPGRSLGVSRTHQIFHCSNCKRSGNSIRFYRDAGDYFCSVSTVAHIMAEEANLDFDE